MDTSRATVSYIDCHRPHHTATLSLISCPPKTLCLQKGVIGAGFERVCYTAAGVIGISCAILILLFIFQRLGTSKLGHCFAPVIILWFVANFIIGIYNIVKWHPGELLPRPTAHPPCLVSFLFPTNVGLLRVSVTQASHRARNCCLL